MATRCEDVMGTKLGRQSKDAGHDIGAEEERAQQEASSEPDDLAEIQDSRNRAEFCDAGHHGQNDQSEHVVDDGRT